MEEILNQLKIYILAKLHAYIDTVIDKTTPIPYLTDSTIVVGDCDIVRHADPNILFINPDIINFTDLTISDYDQTLSVDFLFICRKDVTDILFRRTLRYAAALQALFMDDQNLQGNGLINIDNLNYFDGIEGNTAIKGAVLSCTVTF